MDEITSKRDMYSLLERGAFGNTIPMWTDLHKWLRESPGHQRWGVRTMAPGGPCSLNCDIHDVPNTFLAFRAAGHRPQISMMVDQVAAVSLMADVWESPSGLVVYGIEYPAPGTSWRAVMPTQGRHWEGTAAQMLLARHLNPNSRDDLADVLARYPGAVCELSALDRCIGTVPHRNAVVWEVRHY